MIPCSLTKETSAHDMQFDAAIHDQIHFIANVYTKVIFV